MVNLTEKTLKGIEEYAKLKKEIKDFEAEVTKHEQEAKKIHEQQAENFNFERAKELNMLETIIIQAKDALGKRKRDTAKQLEAWSLKSKISSEVGRLIEEDDELLKIEVNVMKKIDGILKDIDEYRTLFKFTRNKLQEDIMALSDENLRALVVDLSVKSEYAPFSNLTLERAIRNFKSPEVNN